MTPMEIDLEIGGKTVHVESGWVPGERDIFGRILNWGLPIHVAVSKPKWAEKNRVRVYELTLISQGPKSPPIRQVLGRR